MSRAYLIGPVLCQVSLSARRPTLDHVLERLDGQVSEFRRTFHLPTWLTGIDDRGPNSPMARSPNGL
jgi:hypothetical protein